MLASINSLQNCLATTEYNLGLANNASAVLLLEKNDLETIISELKQSQETLLSYVASKTTELDELHVQTTVLETALSASRREASEQSYQMQLHAENFENAAAECRTLRTCYDDGMQRIEDLEQALLTCQDEVPFFFNF